MLRFNILIFNFQLESCARTSRGSRPTLLLMLWFLSRKVAMTTCKLARMRVWDDRKILWARETQPLSDAHLERDQNKYEGLCYPNGLMTTTCQQVWAGTSSPLSLGCNCKPGGGRRGGGGWGHSKLTNNVSVSLDKQVNIDLVENYSHGNPPLLSSSPGWAH